MSNIDWDNAPEGAEFYAFGDFRKCLHSKKPAINNSLGQWIEGRFSIKECKLAEDYCAKPKPKPQTQQNAPTIAQEPLNGDDPVNHPKHYKIAPEVEAIDIIRASLTPEQFKGYLLGNFLKYRLLAGDKGDLNQDIEKSNWYKRELNK